MNISGDLTEGVRAETWLLLLESATANALDAVLITEADPIDEPGPRIVYANEAFTRMTGYAHEEVVGKTPRLLQGPETDRSELDRIRAAITNWEPVQAEIVNYRKDGTKFWVELNVVPITDESGRLHSLPIRAAGNYRAQGVRGDAQGARGALPGGDRADR